MQVSFIPDSSLPSYQINSSKSLKEVSRHLCREVLLFQISHSSIYTLHRASQEFLSGSFQPPGNAQVFLSLNDHCIPTFILVSPNVSNKKKNLYIVRRDLTWKNYCKKLGVNDSCRRWRWAIETRRIFGHNNCKQGRNQAKRVFPL